jgi:hypothetical protein
MIHNLLEYLPIILIPIRKKYHFWSEKFGKFRHPSCSISDLRSLENIIIMFAYYTKKLSYHVI